MITDPCAGAGAERGQEGRVAAQTGGEVCQRVRDGQRAAQLGGDALQERGELEEVGLSRREQREGVGGQAEEQLPVRRTA